MDNQLNRQMKALIRISKCFIGCICGIGVAYWCDLNILKAVMELQKVLPIVIAVFIAAIIIRENQLLIGILISILYSLIWIIDCSDYIFRTYSTSKLIMDMALNLSAGISIGLFHRYLIKSIKKSKLFDRKRIQTEIVELKPDDKV
ncbi:MAG: hypothetical protein WCX65_02690 [bacterium]